MKLNWGHSIVIAIFCFMSFILYFVIKVQSDSKYDNDLVVEEYYKVDALFSDEMVKMQNVADMTVKPIVGTEGDDIKITFPDAVAITAAKAIFYRPSNKKLDFEKVFDAGQKTLTIPKSTLAGGVWEVTLTWEQEGKMHKMKKEIYLEM
ncbi:MAG: FixH family protein [Flavobacterium sp.]|nr:FixH family protein [Flavobacterium sp.]